MYPRSAGEATRTIIALVLSALLVINTVICFDYYFYPTNLSTTSLENVVPQTIEAREVLAKISIGEPAEYDQVIIKGDLSLNQLDLPTIPRMTGAKYIDLSSYSWVGYNYTAVTPVVSQIIIRNSRIEGNVDLKNAIFEDSIDFQNTDFNGSVDFKGSIFSRNASFKKSNFNGNAYFTGSHFNESASFSHAYFDGFAGFGGSFFNGPTEFLYSNFDQGAHFRRSLFNKDVVFGPSNFYVPNSISGGASFGGGTTLSVFNGSADFSGSYFNGNASFCSRAFRGFADFSSTHFQQVSDFSSSAFSETADFRDAQFVKAADLSQSQFAKVTFFEGSHFYDILDLTRLEFNRLEIYWPSVNRLICNDGPTYLSLIKNYRELEQFGAADDIYFQYRYWRQNQRSWSDGYKYFDMLSLISCGYGVRGQYTILSGLIAMIFFGLYFSLKSGILELNKEEKILKIRESIFFSLTLLLSAPSDWYAHIFGNDTYKNLVIINKYSIILERIIGWSLLILLINTLSRVMIRY